MKAFLISLFVLSTSAMAGELVGDFPKIQFGNVFVPVNEVCVAGDSVKTINAVPVCVGYGRGDSSDCTREVYRYLSTPINYVKQIPTGEGSFETVHMSIPLHYNIVFGYQSEGGITPVETRHFSLPVCK